MNFKKYCYEERAIDRWMGIIDETPVWNDVRPTSDDHNLNKPLDLKFTS